MTIPSMTPNKPYFLRALYEWIADNNMIPYIAVDATRKNLKIPFDYVKNNQIVLDLSLSAAHNLQMTNHAVLFNARFGGNPMSVYIPVGAISAIYARETGEGMMFDTYDDEGDGDDTPPSTTDDSASLFKIVK